MCIASSWSFFISFMCGLWLTSHVSFAPSISLSILHASRRLWLVSGYHGDGGRIPCLEVGLRSLGPDRMPRSGAKPRGGADMMTSEGGRFLDVFT